jgi:hypothetical protein
MPTVGREDDRSSRLPVVSCSSHSTDKWNLVLTWEESRVKSLCRDCSRESTEIQRKIEEVSYLSYRGSEIDRIRACVHEASYVAKGHDECLFKEEVSESRATQVRAAVSACYY